MLTANEITSEEFERRFSQSENVLDYIDFNEPVLQSPLPRNDTQRQVNVSLPAWLVDFMDDEASRRGISRKAVINDWLVDRADQEFLRRITVARVD